jgi:hypothetical protein
MILEEIYFNTNFYNITGMETNDSIENWFNVLDEELKKEDIKETFVIDNITFTLKYSKIYEDTAQIIYDIIIDTPSKINMDILHTKLSKAINSLLDKLNNFFDTNSFTKYIPNAYCIYDADKDKMYVEVYRGQSQLDIELNTLQANASNIDMDFLMNNIAYSF